MKRAAREKKNEERVVLLCARQSKSKLECKYKGKASQTSTENQEEKYLCVLKTMPYEEEAAAEAAKKKMKQERTTWSRLTGVGRLLAFTSLDHKCVLRERGELNTHRTADAKLRH